jgi:hypothetical protein
MTSRKIDSIDYDTVLKESAILTTFDGVLFDFLLNISIRGTNQRYILKKSPCLEDGTTNAIPY